MEWTVKEFAARERVDERTVRRWITKGAIDVRRTPGGGIRIHERRTPRAVIFRPMTNSDNPGHPST
jgi:excisionase family DNA binding protein